MKYPDTPLILLFVATLVAGIALLVSELVHRAHALSKLERLRIVLTLLVCLAGLNWVIGHLVVFDRFLGGDAFRGKIEGQQHFLGRGSGEFTPVSKDLYWFNYWYMIASAILLPACAVLLTVVSVLYARACRGRWLRRVDHLRQRGDAEALLEVLDNLDSEGADVEMLEALASVIQEKSRHIKVELRPPFSAMAPVSVRKDQKAMWIAFVNAQWHELFPEASANRPLPPESK